MASTPILRDSLPDPSAALPALLPSPSPSSAKTEELLPCPKKVIIVATEAEDAVGPYQRLWSLIWLWASFSVLALESSLSD